VGFSCGLIHTPKDTVADVGNLDYLALWMKAFVNQLKD